jgi:hypothetical protein
MSISFSRAFASQRFPNTRLSMKLWVRLCCLSILTVIGLQVSPGQAQQALPAGASQAGLPVSKIVLYTSGVGYFQHDGRVDGRGEVTFHFKADNINDLLKSMVVQDLDGGQVTTVVYDSRDPLEKALKSFAIDLTANPGLGAVLQQIRGELLEVATPAPVRGTILGVEKKTERVGEREVIEIEYLNLLTDNGLRTIPLSQLQRVTLLNSRLEGELRQALDTLAARHNTEKKTVQVVFDGSGQRRVRLAYIVATPVWKTSYRLVLSDSSPPLLQGWAIVENTTDNDWQNVQLSLVSGRPISFVMDLYEPLYVERPTVVPELHAALRPPVYEQALETTGALSQKAERQEEERDEAQERRGLSRRADSPAKAQALAAPAAAPPAAEQPGLEIQQGVIAAAQAAALGELFEYTVRAPVSLVRQTSAMLPIVNAPVEGTKLSIYNARVHAKYPLHGVRLRNTTALSLMPGPITVFEGGGYVGDARLPDLAPGGEQLISYALDLKVEVEPAAPKTQQELVSVSLRKGILVATHKTIAETTYTIKNRDQKQKMLLLEHPWRPDWQLIAPGQASERTRDAYRFLVTLAPEQSTQLLVREEKPLQQTVRLLDAGPDRIAYYLQAQQLSPAVQQALQKAVTLRERLEQTRTQVQRLAQRLETITQEQSRIRQNMERLATNSDLYNRYVRKLDQQETEIDSLRKESDNLKATEERQKRELEEYLLGLDLN